MRENLNNLLNNRGSGLGVIFYGITLLLVLIFTAINILNSKVVEDGYNSLREAVQAASSGAVIHLLTEQVTDASTGKTAAQKETIKLAGYDLYLQLALGYFINWEEPASSADDTMVQTGDINNFIKLDHQKVVNSTLALFENAIYRDDSQSDISNVADYKIMMFFIEPYQEGGTKFFDIIAYGNGDYGNGVKGVRGTFEDIDGNLYVENNCKTITSELVRGQVKGDDMAVIYDRIEKTIESIVNCEVTIPSWTENKRNVPLDDYKVYNGSQERKYEINLSVPGSAYRDKIRELETKPYYLIVVKDFALPTIFYQKTTANDGTGIWSAFNKASDNQNSRLKTPMCALNSGKVERQYEDEGWSHDR